MEQTQLSLPDAVTEVRNVSASVQSKMLDICLDPEEIHGTTSVRVSHCELVDLIQHIKPKVVFFFCPHFSASQEAMEFLVPEADDEGDNEFELDRRKQIENDLKFKSLVKRYRQFRGEFSFLLSSFIDNQIAFYSYDAAPWFQEFWQDLDQYKQRLNDERLERFEDENLQETKAIESAVTQLLNDPRFVAPRTSRAKRLYLAENLFPEMFESQRQKVVERAELKLWLDSTSTVAAAGNDA